MKYNSVMSLTNLKGKFERSNEEERTKYKEVNLHVTEKGDGENWRIGLEEGRKFIGGRKHLFYWDEIAKEFIHDFTHKSHPNWTKINEETKGEVFRLLEELEETEHTNIILYGELCGNGLQERFEFDYEGYTVFYYEMAIDERYVDQLEAFDWFERLGLKKVPYVGAMTLEEFLVVDIEAMKSQMATNSYIEGIVGVPIGGAYEWDFADRFIIKKKIKKFAETKPAKGRSKKAKYKSPYSIHMTEERLKHVLQDLKEDGHLFSHENEFRMMVVDKILGNIQDEENNGEEFSKEDRRVLSSEAHRLFSQYNTL